MNFELNGKNIRNVDEFHKAIKSGLDLPEYYGENLDALWDVLTAWVEMPLTIIWRDFDLSKKFMGQDADRIIKFFEDVETEVKGFKVEVYA